MVLCRIYKALSSRNIAGMSLASAQEKNMQAAYDSHMKATYNCNDINAINGNTYLNIHRNIDILIV